MKTAISFGGAGATGEDWPEVVEYVREAERLGVDFAWSAEAWGQDAVTTVAFLAAVTSRIRLGTGIMQITARAPSMTAMTARSLDLLSGGRFVLGLGVSGPQVVEGLHGVRFEPASRAAPGDPRRGRDGPARRADRVFRQAPHVPVAGRGGQGHRP